MTTPMTDFDVWLKLHTVLVNLCAADRIDWAQHERWERLIAETKGEDR